MIQFLGRDQTGLPRLFGQFFPLHTERTLGQPFLTDTNFNHLPQHQEFQIKRTSANRGFFLSLYLLFNFGLGLGANPSSPLRKSKSRLIVNRVEAMLPPKFGEFGQPGILSFTGCRIFILPSSAVPFVNRPGFWCPLRPAPEQMYPPVF